MATKKTINQPQTVMLTISNEEFKQILTKRIEVGKEMFQNDDNYIQLDKEFKLWDEYNIEVLKQCFNYSDNSYKRTYYLAGFHTDAIYSPVQAKKNLIICKLENLESLLNRADLIKSEVAKVVNKPVSHSENSLSKNEVFIVHGHDDLAKNQVARFIEKLGLKPIILHEQVNSGKTIIEKIEEYSNVGFGIVVYTSCDKGCKNGEEANLSNRARQNVVFEHGYLIGKIGRKNVCALVKSDIETPNDISGVVYIPMDSDESWHLKIAKELKSSSYNIDLNKLI